MGHRRKASSLKVSENRMRQQIEATPLSEPCPDCGKSRYRTRRAAKAARRRHKKDTLSVYLCGEYWHFGHTPWQIRRGEQARSNTLGEFHPDWRAS